VFTNYYAKLSEVVPFKEWSHYFVSAGIITNEDNKIIQSTVQPYKIASHVLDRIYQSLKLGGDYMFNKLLLIMEQHGNVSCIELANQIRGNPSKRTVLLNVTCVAVILFILLDAHQLLSDIEDTHTNNTVANDNGKDIHTGDNNTV